MVTYHYGAPGTPAVTIHMNGENGGFYTDDAVAYREATRSIRFNKANVIYIEWTSIATLVIRSRIRPQRRLDQGHDRCC